MPNHLPEWSQLGELSAFASEQATGLGVDGVALARALTGASLRVCRESMPLNFALRSALEEASGDAGPVRNTLDLGDQLTLAFARFLTSGPGLDVVSRICEEALASEGEPLPSRYCHTRLQAEADAFLAVENVEAGALEVERLILSAKEVVPLEDIAVDYTIGSAIEVVLREREELHDALRIGFAQAIENGFICADDPKLRYLVDWKLKKLADNLTEERFLERLVQVIRNDQARRGYIVESMRSLSRAGVLFLPEAVEARLLEVLK